MAKSFETIEDKLKAFKDKYPEFTYTIYAPMPENNYNNINLPDLRCGFYYKKKIDYIINLISDHVRLFYMITINTSFGTITCIFKENTLFITIHDSYLSRYVDVFNSKYSIFLCNDFSSCFIRISDDNSLILNDCELSNDAKILIKNNNYDLYSTIELLHHPNVYIYTKSKKSCYKFYNIISDDEEDIFDLLEYP